MRPRHYLLMIALALTTSFGIISCEKDNDEGDMNTGPTVNMRGNVFLPVSLQVAAGTVVTWQNSDNVIHTVTASDGSFDSGDLEPGDTFTFTFTEGAIYSYHCTHHAGMIGSVEVIDR